MNNYICHSGGCPGADMTWENEGLKFGVHTIAYSFWNHKQEGRNQKILSGAELAEGFEAVMRANDKIKRYPQGQPQYVKNLLARNWFQVKNSEAIFAIAKKFLTNHIVDGGTGWAVQMAIDCDKPVFAFLQDSMGGGWFRYMPIVGFESCRGEIPTLTENFAGIGTREINQWGIKAIQEVYRKNFPPKLELIHHEGKDILYIEGLPAWSWVDGERDWIAPDTATIYSNNQKFVDEWCLKNNFTGR